MRFKGYLLDSLKLDNEYTIYGLFSSAIYLENSNSETIIIYDRSYGLLPFGIEIDNFKEKINTNKLNIGEKVLIKNNQLIINQDIIIDLVSIKKEVLSKTLSNDEIIESSLSGLKNSDKGIAKGIIFSEFNNIYSTRALKFIDKLKSGEVEVLKELIGLGPGLTPSFDDFTLGYLKALYFIEDYGNIEKIKNVLPNFFNNTNKHSVPYLKAGLNNEYIEVIDKLLLSKSIEILNKNIEDLLKVGSNSGADILTGIIFGLK